MPEIKDTAAAGDRVLIRNGDRDGPDPYVSIARGAAAMVVGAPRPNTGPIEQPNPPRSRSLSSLPATEAKYSFGDVSLSRDIAERHPPRAVGPITRRFVAPIESLGDDEMSSERWHSHAGASDNRAHERALTKIGGSG